MVILMDTMPPKLKMIMITINYNGIIIDKSNYNKFFIYNIIIKLFIIIYNMYKNIVRNNVTLFSIALFVIIFTIIQMMKPGFLYNKDGSIRVFGIGYKNKTIFPIWILSLILGILCYLFILYYVSRPTLF